MNWAENGIAFRSLRPTESSRRDSNPRPRAYKALALTAELREEVRADRPMPSMPRIMGCSFRLWRPPLSPIESPYRCLTSNKDKG